MNANRGNQPRRKRAGKNMRRTREFDLLSAAQWLDLASNPNIVKRIADDPYCVVYHDLLAHFINLKAITWSDAIVGLHIVYGWMPTIPRFDDIEDWNQSEKDQLVAALNDARNGSVPSDKQFGFVKAFCNNSVVGASKLLHFLNPGKLPIWDSRVAKVFLGRRKVTHDQVNKIANWQMYQKTLTNWLLGSAVQKRCAELRRAADHLTDVTDLRLIELVIFHKTVSGRKRRRKAG
jgi:hypothetical protein